MAGGSALFRMQTTSKTAERAIVRIPVEAIRTNPQQPRRSFPPGAVEELAASIRRHGLLSPILVRMKDDGNYELVAGERRLRALISLGKRFVDAVVISAGDCECALIALVENIQREQLHFFDEAEACRRVLSDYGITQESLADGLSCSPSALANRLRLLKLPTEVRQFIRERGLTERHARALLKLGDAGAQMNFARQAVEQRMSVKQLESHIEQYAGRMKKEPARRISPVIRDNRIVINAIMDTVRELGRIGVRVKSRIEEKDDHVELIVLIPACSTAEDRQAFQKNNSRNPSE